MGRGAGVAGVARVGVAAVALWAGLAPARPAAAQETVPLPQVEVRGSGEPTLLLIGCASCGWKSWEAFMERHAERYTTVAVTLPGYGGTARPDLPLWNATPVWQENAIRALSELLDERGLERVVLVGHSFGTLIALGLAEARPERVAGVVNVDGSLWSSPALPTLGERLARAAEIRAEYMAPLEDPERWRAFNTPSISDPDLRMLHHGMFMATDRLSMEQYWWENLLQDRNEAFLGLDAPVLDVQAQRPWVENQDSARAAYLEGLDGVGRPRDYRLVFFPRTRHWIHYERPELFDRVLAGFLAGDPGEAVTVVDVPGGGGSAGGG